jgi:hypothetical protein
MIGAMPAVAVRHERRKNKTKDKPVRPTKLQVTTYLFMSSGVPETGKSHFCHH